MLNVSILKLTALSRKWTTTSSSSTAWRHCFIALCSNGRSTLTCTTCVIQDDKLPTCRNLHAIRHRYTPSIHSVDIRAWSPEEKKHNWWYSEAAVSLLVKVDCHLNWSLSTIKIMTLNFIYWLSLVFHTGGTNSQIPSFPCGAGHWLQ